MKKETIEETAERLMRIVQGSSALEGQAVGPEVREKIKQELIKKLRKKAEEHKMIEALGYVFIEYDCSKCGASWESEDHSSNDVSRAVEFALSKTVCPDCGEK